MFKFICKRLLHVSSSAATVSSAHNFYSLQTHFFSSSSKSVISNRNPPNKFSFAVTYLINSLGFTPERALSASKHVKFGTPDKADSVLAFLKNHGFTQTQISTIVRKNPRVLLYDAEKTLLPKLEFLKSKGVSSRDVASIVYGCPLVLKRSLENKIIPSFNFFSNLYQSEEKTIASIKRFAGLLLVDQTQVTTNIGILREAGVPNANIMNLLVKQPRMIVADNDWFRKIVDEVKKMGFDPLRVKFMVAVHALRSMTKSTWDKKVEIYKNWGWTEDEILVAFGKQPWCMTASENKINGVMEFVVNKLGWESSYVAERPLLISMSLEKRLVPRAEVYQALLSKNLIKTKDVGLSRLLHLPEVQFLKKVLSYNEEEVPELLKLYKEKLDLVK